MNMTRLRWHPKVYAEGDIDGAGLRKLLGASHHDPLALLVRETIQNSWDASRRPDGGPQYAEKVPRWIFELRTLTREERTELREAFDAEVVPGTRLIEDLEAPQVRVIEISDRNTAGLGGPIRPDIAIPRDLPTDFIDLVFNVGAPQDARGGGGTYGFGKIAAFGVSHCSTVLYRTQPIHGATPDEAPQHRLIGSTIGDHFEHRGRRHTGRHWWGDVVDGHPRPLTGEEARALGEHLFAHPFEQGETGTSILIIQPDLAGLEDDEAIKHVVDAVLWNAWPKLVPLQGESRPPMELSVRLDGREVPIPDPAQIHPFSGFVDALLNVRARAEGRDAPAPVGTWTSHVREATFESSRPRRLVGHVAVAHTLGGPLPDSRAPDDGAVSARHFHGPAHHLALMREPELIVRYLEGPPPPQPDAQYCGVFKPVRELDHVFAEAEPPSHDDWLVGRVRDRNSRIFVRRGREKGPNELFASLSPRAEDVVRRTTGHRLAAVADALGGLLTAGQRVTPPRPGPSRPPRGRPRILTVRGSTAVRLPDGSRGVRVDFSLTRAAALRLSAAVALAGGGADSSDDLADRQPQLLGVTRAGEAVSEALGVSRPHLDAGDWQAWVKNPGGVALAVDINVDEES